jgi:hypothetical protein
MSRTITTTPVGLAAAALAAAALVTGCAFIDREVVRGSGTLVTEALALAGFDRIEVDRVMDLRVGPAQSYAVSLTIDDNLVEYVGLEVRGNTLHIDVDDAVDFRDATHLVEVTMPTLRHLGLHGSASGEMAGFDDGEDLELDISGASDLACGDVTADEVSMDLSGASSVDCTGVVARELRAELSGASELRMSGSGTAASLRGSGASEFDLRGFELEDVDVRLSGASSAEVDVSGRLEADLSGASNVRYAGSPSLGRIDTSGASKVEPAD